MTDRYAKRQSLGERFGNRVRDLFPERQIVLRTEGRVSYLRLTAAAQACIVMGVAAFGGWVTFASIKYAVHERIVVAKEIQIADARMAHRALLNDVRAYQKKFTSVTKDIEASHGVMLGLVEQNASLQQSLRSVETRLETTEKDREFIVGARERLKDNLKDLQRRLYSLANNNFALKENLTSIEEDLEQATVDRDKAREEGRVLQERKEQLESRLAELQEMEQEAVQKLTDRTVSYVDSLQRVIEMAGLDVNGILAAESGVALGQGGPFVEMEMVHDDLPGAALKSDLVSLDAHLERSSLLQSVMRKMPLAAPMETYYITSSFGKRRDPVNKRWAMHYGLDLGAPVKSSVYSTAAGTVAFAGWKGKYGKMVEIDHGAGLVTRFGHLDKTLVKKGQKVGFHDKIGLLGNTGRSTGAHLHYEIVFKGKNKNPMKFIKAGRHVFQE